jgi:sulfide:quinone oxidoreductase
LALASRAWSWQRDDRSRSLAAPVARSQGSDGKEVSQSIPNALAERGIEYVPNQLVTEIDARGRKARLASGGSVSYDLFIGIPIHRVPEVVESSGLSVDGWVPVDRTNLATRFADVYALGDVAGTPVAKAGVFAESAAAVVENRAAQGHREPQYLNVLGRPRTPRCEAFAAGQAVTYFSETPLGYLDD